MKPRKPDPLPRIRIQLGPSDLLSPNDLRSVSAGGAKSPAPKPGSETKPQDENSSSASGQGGLESPQP